MDVKVPLDGAMDGSVGDGGAADALRALMIRSITREAEGLWAFELVPVDGGPLPDYAPGAHLDLHLPGGLVRQYSLTNPADGRRYVLGVARDRASRGGSRWLHDQARPGDVIQASDPRNTFPLDEDAPLSVLVAGGVGVTPLLAMARRLDALGRPWRLHYAVRDRSVAAFVDRFQAMKGEVALHVDAETGGLMDIAAVVAGTPPEARLYCCGPTPMIEAFEAAASGRDPAHVRVERFAAAAPRADDGSLTVELARSGLTVHVGPDETILDAVLAAGVQAPASCRNGVCGTCETRVLAGVPDHRDMILSDAEKQAGQTMMICCSRARSPSLTLDL